MYERSLFFIDLRSVEIFEIGWELKLCIGREDSVKKAISWQSRASQCTNFICAQINSYVELLDTCYEIIRKSEVLKIVIFGHETKTCLASYFLTDFKNGNGSDTYEACATSVHNKRKIFKIWLTLLSIHIFFLRLDYLWCFEATVPFIQELYSFSQVKEAFLYSLCRPFRGDLNLLFCKVRFNMHFGFFC